MLGEKSNPILPKLLKKERGEQFAVESKEENLRHKKFHRKSVIEAKLGD